jgi:hypothetical protein
MKSGIMAPSHLLSIESHDSSLGSVKSVLDLAVPLGRNINELLAVIVALPQGTIKWCGRTT